MKIQADILVVGAGLVGLTTALALSKIQSNLGKITLCAPNLDDQTVQDGRSTALLANSVDFLKGLGIWESNQDFAFPLRTMRIIDGTNRLVRAPQTDFNSSEIGLEAFGYNVLNAKLIGLLFKALKHDKKIELLDDSVNAIEIDDKATLVTFEKTTARKFDLIAACDGRNSSIRKQLGLGFELKKYPQVALVGNIAHSLPHHDTSTEFHTETGPFTLVPLGENKSSFVCVETEGGASELRNLSVDELNAELERRSHSILGKIRIETEIQQFPLSISNTSDFSKSNIVFLGEAAHVMPPIGAQGFNIGIRDVLELQSLCADQANTPLEVAQQYQKNRRLDVQTRMRSVDLLNRSLLSDMLPSQVARSFGLYALSSFNPLRHFAMKEGVEPGRGFRELADGLLPKSFQRTK